MKAHLSLRWKLTILVVGGSIVIAAFAALGFAWLDLKRFRLHLQSEAAAMGDVMASQTGPALTLGDRRAATEILASLHADTLIGDAMLYDASGGCFAYFHDRPSRDCPSRLSNGIYQDRNRIVLARPVTNSDDYLGTLVLFANPPSVGSVLREYFGGAGLIIGLSLVIAALIAMVLQSQVSKPILEIARVAQNIAATHRFEDRVKVDSSDELGVLAHSFNDMLDEIARRNSELAAQRLSLEDEVSERKRVNTELIVAKDRAEDAVRLKSEFLANMSHEIRTPMNGVLGMIGLVLDNCPESEDRERLLTAQNAAQSLVSILNDILDLSKVEAGKMTYEKIPFDLSEAVHETTRTLGALAQQKHLKIACEVARDCPDWVLGDPVRVRQILINLLGNAVKFTSIGSVTLAVETATPGVLRFTVSDTGIGIPAAKLESIFDAFTQADGSHTRQYGGTGLGLTITRRLVDLMGGRVWAESKEGAGSRFTFELALPETAPPKKAPSVRPVIRPHLRVLVAEDNPVNQKVITALLLRQGWTVILAGNGREACDRFAGDAFDVVLMDIQMPEMDGVEATRRIRAAEHITGAPRTPIVALTAHAWKPQQDEYLAEGMDSVITKPLSEATLLRGIAEVLVAQPVPSGAA